MKEINMISRKYLLTQTSLLAFLLTGTLCASSTSAMLSEEASGEEILSRISRTLSTQELHQNTPSLTDFLPEILEKIATKADKKSWDHLKITSKMLNKICMDADVLLPRGSNFVIKSLDDLKEISDIFHKDARCHVPIVFEYSAKDEDLQYLANATHVNLSRCTGVTDEGLAHLKMRPM